MNLARIPDSVSLEQAVMVPDMMCTAFEGVRELRAGFGETVVVLGVGPVGLMAVRAAVLSGAARVFAVGSRKVYFSAAKEFGATDTIDYHDPGYVQTILARNGFPADGVVVAGGDESSIGPAFKLLKNGGTVVNLNAYFGGKPLTIDPADWGFGYGDKTIKGVGCGGGRLWMKRMLALIETGRVQPEKLVTHRFHGMDSIPEAVELFLRRDRSLIKPVIYND